MGLFKKLFGRKESRSQEAEQLSLLPYETLDGEKSVTDISGIKNAPSLSGHFDLNSIPVHQILLSKVPMKRRKNPLNIRCSEINESTDPDNFVSIYVCDRTCTYNRIRITEISAIKFKNGKPIERFHSLVNPELPVPKSAVVSKYDIPDEILFTNPTISEILPDFDQFVTGENVVGHWLIFDLDELYLSGSNIFDLANNFYRTCDIVKELSVPIGVTLDSSYEHYGIPIPETRNYESHALAYGELFRSVCFDVKNRLNKNKNPEEI